MKKRLFSLLAVLTIIVGTVMPVKAEHAPRFVDEVGKMSTEEAAEVLERLDEISERYQVDIVGVIVNDRGAKSMEAFADDYYDYNGFEYRGGIVLAIDMGDRSYHFSGDMDEGMQTFSLSVINYMEDDVVSYLKENDYYGAFMMYANYCEEILYNEEQYETGGIEERVDYEKIEFEKNRATPIQRILISFAIGFVLSCIPIGIYKGQLKTVRFRSGAKEYTRPGSFGLTEQRDIFLYRNVVKREIPQSSSSSSSHTSSSGHSHSGSGGHF